MLPPTTEGVRIIVTRDADRSLQITRRPCPWDAVAHPAPVPLMARNVTTPQLADTHPLEDMVTELAPDGADAPDGQRQSRTARG